MKSLSKNRGLTLMEMMVTLMILGLIATLGAPNLSEFIEDNRLNAAVGDLVSSIQAGRAEAVGRNAYVTLCKKNAGSTACVAGGGWQQGWITFVDVDGDGVIDAGDGDEIVAIHDALLGSVTLHGTAGVANLITFRPSGQTSIITMQAIIACDSRGFVSDSKGMVISIMGRASTMSAADTGQTSCLTS
ncbi:GspH/FimT family pseudopilin [Candidatus Litorirhabdus singularis]|nr:GspH/FimT family pseudopilin [Candidatus Litorirhabdus singularis]